MRSSGSSKEEIDKNVIDSTENALFALTQMEQNLIKGRFKEGILPYEQMCKTLLAQRLWTLDKKNEKLINNFFEISERAKSIIGMLMPYVENLNKLVLDERLGSDVLKREKLTYSPEENEIIKCLEDTPGKHLSYTRICKKLKWKKDHTDKILIQLENKKVIKIVKSGSRRIIHLG